MKQETKEKISKNHKLKGIKPNPLFSVATQFKKGMTPWNKGNRAVRIPKISTFKKKEKVQKICETCQISFLIPVWRVETAKFCSRKCQTRGISGVGITHPRWIADRLKLKTERRHSYDSVYKLWSKNVKNRDGWKCKISNGDCSGRLESHHILGWKDHPELRYQINNGITLCCYHHPRKREEEKQLSPYFQELVSKAN